MTQKINHVLRIVNRFCISYQVLFKNILKFENYYF